MFAKAFCVKSNTAIKGSDRRKLRADMTAAFPTLGTNQASELVPWKEELSIVKLYAHRGDAMTVYVQKGDLCAIVLVGNKAPVAIRVAAMSTSEMLTSGLKGRGFSMLHTYEDHLWRSGDKTATGHKEVKLQKTLQVPAANAAGAEQIIQVKELSKGVESIVAVDWKHPRITSFVIPGPSPTSPTIQEGSREQPCHPPDIKPLYCVPDSMSLLFQESGHKKGSILEGCEVRMIINYAKKNDLVDADNKNLVHLDPILCDCILEKSEQHIVMKLPWDSLLTRCLEKLQPAYQVTFPGQEPIVKKGKICPIDITLAQRASNKKVTVVWNLETYSLDLCTVAATLQQRCQASTTVTPAPGAKDSLQVQIQGNQVHHLGRLLLEEYQLPQKHIQGLKKAPKLGKKK
uniref:Eukaryotic translation initiation factor 2D n=1 Tax=Myotis myotis TaxID=51298 RepID=A0A7J7YDZ6_MYOMY|nr:hypothetical protein mMyoMyo1_011116 [Myotis myotis]